MKILITQKIDYLLYSKSISVHLFKFTVSQDVVQNDRSSLLYNQHGKITNLSHSKMICLNQISP